MKKNIILTLSCLLLIIAGCKKEKNDPADNPGTSQLVAEKTDISPFEMAVIAAENLTLTEASYKGMMGGQEITITPFENELYFMTPDIAAGAQTLTVTLEGKEYTVNYTVTALPAITNPETYIAEKITAIQYTDEELNEVKTRLQGKPGAEDINAQMDMIKTVYAEVQQAIHSSTAEEKATLAKFMAANPDLFVKPEFNIDYSGLALHKTTAGSDNIEQIAKDLNNAIQAHKKRIKKGLAVVLASALLGPPAFVTAGVVLAIIYVANSDLTDALGNALDRVGNLITNDLFKTTGSTEFVNGTPYNLNIQSAYGNLNNQSAGSGSTVIQSVANGYYSFGKSWDAFFGKFPKWLKGDRVQLDKITDQKTKSFPVNPAYLSIKNISNPDVTVSVDKTNGKFAATFSSTQTTDQDFEYDIVYTCDGYETTTSHIVAKLVNDIDLSGVWVMSFTLALQGDCDENLFEDEDHIPPTFTFNQDGTITLVTDPIESDLNTDPNWVKNNYELKENNLVMNFKYLATGIQINDYSFDLNYDEGTKRFNGVWNETRTFYDSLGNPYHEYCTNPLKIYRK